MICYRFSVREVAEFCWRRGDYRYPDQPLKPSAKQGQAIHQFLQAQQKDRDEHYQAEVAVSHESLHTHGGEPYRLILRGRIDSLVIQAGNWLVEEIKTTYYSEQELPEDQFQLHLAQAKLYAAMLLATDLSGGDVLQPDAAPNTETYIKTIELRVTYWHLAGEYRYDKACRETPASLQQFLRETIKAFTAWLDRYHEHRLARQRFLEALQFPFQGYREGQRTLAGACYHQAKAGSSLLIHAATGIGKSVSTLFGSLKAMAENHGEQIWYLTAKTSGQSAALQAVKQLQDTGEATSANTPESALKCLSISSQQRACFCEPGAEIHNILCEWEIGFHDRKRAAMAEAYAQNHINLPCLQRIGKEYRVCPYHLCEELLPWVDVVIADFNYVFSLTARNARFLETRMRDINLLVDEAHNLPGRCRESYQASLTQDALHELAKSLKGQPVAKALRKLSRELQHTAADAAEKPAALFKALQQLKEQLELPELSQGQLFAEDKTLQLKITINQWLRLEKYCEAGLGEQNGQPFSLKKRHNTLMLECNNPAVVIEDLSRGFRSRVLFSGSLLPIEHFATQCIVPAENTDNTQPPHLILESPFPRERLKILLGPLAMGYQERDTSLPQALDYIAALYRQQPGLYLVCAPSYTVLNSLEQQLQQQPLSLPVVCQSAASSSATDHQALSSLRDGLAFVVLGGSFAEGVEWPPGVLKGVVILGNGMPGPSTEQKRLQRYYEQAFHRHARPGHVVTNPGFDHAFLFPGLNRVIQTAGRIQRTPEDAGIVLLLDRRFRQPHYQHYLPSHWACETINTPAELASVCEVFWHRIASSAVTS